MAGNRGLLERVTPSNVNVSPTGSPASTVGRSRDAVKLAAQTDRLNPKTNAPPGIHPGNRHARRGERRFPTCLWNGLAMIDG